MPNSHLTYFSEKIRRFIYSSLICLPFLLSSCDNCTFISDNVQFAGVSFYGSDGRAQPKTIDKITGIFSRDNQAMPNPLFEEATTATIFELPIFTRSDTTIFVFTQYIEQNQVIDTIQDTLSMRYKVVVEVLPPDCGYDEAITDLEIIYSTFNSVEVLRQDLKEIGTENPLPHLKIIE